MVPPELHKMENLYEKVLGNASPAGRGDPAVQPDAILPPSEAHPPDGETCCGGG